MLLTDILLYLHLSLRTLKTFKRFNIMVFEQFQDKQFGKVALFYPHSNPEAEVISGMKCYKQFTLERAYLGETFFWGLLPQPSDQLVFKFTTPIVIKRY